MKSKFINYSAINKGILLLLITFISSCASRQDIVYFQDEPVNKGLTMTNNYEIKLKPADMLTIDISAQDPEAVAPFLLTPVAQNFNSALNISNNLRVQTYLIDINGNIEFPVLGTIKMQGLSRIDATEMLKEKLTEYIVNPIVNIRLINFTVTILGEVNKPGSFTVQNERISLNDALGLAGDLTIYGKRDNILLIREVDGQKRYAKFDLNSVNVVNSPNYYLTQNDVIYIEPNNSRVRQSSYNPNNGIIISAIATLATIAAILIK
jgi:polysaccharide export outer membrane protein